jgi:hypothetical protein
MTRSVGSYKGGYVLTNPGTTDVDKLLSNFETLLDATLATRATRIYTGGSATPHPESWISTWSGSGGMLIAVGRDVYAMGLDSLLTLSFSTDVGLDGTLDLTQASALTGCIVHQPITAITVAGLAALESLDLSGCGSLVALPDLTGLTSLQFVDLTGCTALTAAPDVRGLASLQSYSQNDCSSMASYPDFTGCTNLAFIDLYGCNLSEVDGVFNLIDGQPHQPNGTLNVDGGGNAAPTGASAAARADLGADGWSSWLGPWS